MRLLAKALLQPSWASTCRAGADGGGGGDRRTDGRQPLASAGIRPCSVRGDARPPWHQG